MNAVPRRALVLFSGGQDSAVSLAWALSRYEYVETVGFDDGQRHVVELECRLTLRAQLCAAFPAWGERMGDDHLLDLSVLQHIAAAGRGTARAREMAAAGMPDHFVPGRNLLYLAAAGALAQRRGLQVLVGGMGETDFSAFPDCRDTTMQAMGLALSLGMDARMSIDTPLMRLDKAQIWQLGEALGGERLNALIVAHTHSCVLGERGERHDWGHGCGQCPACALRMRGYRAWRGLPGAGEGTDTDFGPNTDFPDTSVLDTLR